MTVLYTVAIALKVYQRRGRYLDDNINDIEIDGRSPPTKTRKDTGILIN